MANTMPQHLPDGIFIVGCPRSGTTLLQTLLACHPLVTSFSESNFFGSSFARVPKTSIYYLHRPPDQRVLQFLSENQEPAAPHHEILTRLSSARRYSPPSATRAAVDFVDLLNSLGSRRNAQVWLEKSPVHLWFLPLIDRAASRTGATIKVIHAVRYGPDVVASLHRASRHWPCGKYTIGYCVRRWNDDIRATIRRIEKGNDDVIVSYEKLTDQPESTVAQLFDRLALPREANIITKRQIFASKFPPSKKPFHQRLAHPIRKSSTFDAAFTDEKKAWILRNLDRSVWAVLCRNSI